jgi:hypothetical protein
MTQQKFLTAVGDDFGLHPAVNQGMVDAFENGLLTDANDFAKRKARMREKLLALGPGHHLWVVHPAVDDPRLEDMASPDNLAFNYTRIFRVNDCRLLVDTDVKTWIEELGIRIVPLSEVPVVRPVPTQEGHGFTQVR